MADNVKNIFNSQPIFQMKISQNKMQIKSSNPILAHYHLNIKTQEGSPLHQGLCGGTANHWSSGQVACLLSC